jgi:hypothetical protein
MTLMIFSVSEKIIGQVIKPPLTAEIEVISAISDKATITLIIHENGGEISGSVNNNLHLNPNDGLYYGSQMIYLYPVFDLTIEVATNKGEYDRKVLTEYQEKITFDFTD